MEEFLRLIAALSEAVNPLKAAQVGDYVYTIGYNDTDIPEELREDLLRKALKRREGMEVRHLDYVCNVDIRDKSIFNDGLGEIAEKYNLTPEDFGLDLASFGFCFVFMNDKFDHDAVRQELLDLLRKLRTDTRAFFITKGVGSRVFEIKNKKVVELFVPQDEAKMTTDRRVIQENEILDIKIALNRGDERDCLEVIEELMRLGS